MSLNGQQTGHPTGMIMTLDTARLRTIEQIQAFMQGTAEVGFSPPPESERYAWIGRTLSQFAYHGRDRRERGLLHRFIARVTGYSRAQLNRLITQHRLNHCLKDRRGPPAAPFSTRYGAAALRCLIEIDRAHDTLSGPATKKLAERAVKVHGQHEFAALSNISVSHLYNLRKSAGYLKARVHFTQTTAPRKPVTIGVRKRPDPKGRAGFLRIDSVHQGDHEGAKGIYYINVVDCVTQFQAVFAVAAISEAFLLPVLLAMIEAFPFTILGFHSDNGSEYINARVASLLEKLLIEQTKSRARRSNDNALAESKNGAVIRKHFGYSHIPKSFAEPINQLCQLYLIPYLNFHRPCFFPTTEIDAKGKAVKRYRYADMMTPYEKLKSLPNAAAFLKLGVSFEQLDKVSTNMTDNEAALLFTSQRNKIFKQIFKTKSIGLRA
jgi:transposase InsO family protein